MDDDRRPGGGEGGGPGEGGLAESGLESSTFGFSSAGRVPGRCGCSALVRPACEASQFLMLREAQLPMLPTRPPAGQALPLHTTLVVCLLACWQLREAVSPLDLARWALDGALPYLLPRPGALERVQAYRSVLHPSILTPPGVPTPHLLCTKAITLAAGLRLPCPPVNTGLWLERYARDLALPDVSRLLLFFPGPCAPFASTEDCSCPLGPLAAGGGRAVA